MKIFSIKHINIETKDFYAFIVSKLRFFIFKRESDYDYNFLKVANFQGGVFLRTLEN